MRTLATLGLLGLLGLPAHALVIEEPGIYYACPNGKRWDAVAACLGKHGRPAIVKEAPGAKLVRLDQSENGVWVDGGVYLYVEYKQQWKIAGSFFGRGSSYELQKLEPMTSGKASGYRFDIALATPLSVMVDGLTVQRGIRRAYQTMFCHGQNQYCAQAIRSCEVLVHGGAYWTFRGAMTIDGNQVTIAGDRSHAGSHCTQPERVFLGWPSS